jgi:hypothetical protein
VVYGWVYLFWFNLYFVSISQVLGAELHVIYVELHVTMVYIVLQHFCNL